MSGQDTFPRGKTAVLCLAKISEASVICFIMPFINQMVAGFGKDTTSCAKFAGVIESALVLTEAFTSPLWGALADARGRKPLLIVGLSAFAVACIGLGLAKTLWQAVLSRCISGVLGAVSVLVRTVQFEIADASSIDRVLQWMTPCWAIGAALGPMIGGALAEPAKTMPGIFKGSIFDTYPYLLPSVVTAILPAASAVAIAIWLPETLNRPAQTSSEETAHLLTDVTEVTEEPEEVQDLSIIQLLRTPSLLYPLFASGMIAFISMSYNAAFMMMASTPLEFGGLNMAPWQLGLLLAVSSGLGVVVGTWVIPILSSRYGWYGALRLTSFCHVVLFPVIAIAGATSRWEGGVGHVTGSIILILLVVYEVAETSFIGIDVAIADRAPKGCLARINGLSSSTASLGRMIAPTLSGQLWSRSMTMPAPIGYHFIWIVLTFMAILWWMTTLRLESPTEMAARRITDEEIGLVLSSDIGDSASIDSGRYGSFSRTDSIGSEYSAHVDNLGWGSGVTLAEQWSEDEKLGDGRLILQK